jgi:hypothetical protein
VDLVEFLTREGISYVDTLPALRRSIKDQLYAPTTRDMHPGKNGYRVIGKTVVDYLIKHAFDGSVGQAAHAKLSVKPH